MESEKVLLCSSSKGEGTPICSSSDDGSSKWYVMLALHILFLNFHNIRSFHVGNMMQPPSMGPPNGMGMPPPSMQPPQNAPRGAAMAPPAAPKSNVQFFNVATGTPTPVLLGGPPPSFGGGMPPPPFQGSMDQGAHGAPPGSQYGVMPPPMSGGQPAGFEQQSQSYGGWIYFLQCFE